ncbi:MAG: transglycosylase domain-containing protein, partial [Ginsengibacter sp.]
MSKIPLKIKIFFTVAVALFTWFWFSLPSKLFNDPTSFVLEDKDGNFLNASIASDGQWRFPYNENVPDKFITCITTFEDKRFYNHPGIDVLAFIRAALKNLRNKGIVQGGSTLTMQVLRLSRHNTDRNIWGKLVESIQSI